MTKFQIAISSAMLTKDVVGAFDGTYLMAIIGAGTAFTVAIALMLLDGWKRGRS